MPRASRWLPGQAKFSNEYYILLGLSLSSIIPNEVQFNMLSVIWWINTRHLVECNLINLYVNLAGLYVQVQVISNAKNIWVFFLLGI